MRFLNLVSCLRIKLILRILEVRIGVLPRNLHQRGPVVRADAPRAGQCHGIDGLKNGERPVMAGTLVNPTCVETSFRFESKIRSVRWRGRVLVQ